MAMSGPLAVRWQDNGKAEVEKRTKEAAVAAAVCHTM